MPCENYNDEAQKEAHPQDGPVDLGELEGQAMSGKDIFWSIVLVLEVGFIVFVVLVL